MITFFTTPKPFLGHVGVIQRNAIQSWKCLHPDVEVLLFGDEEGAAEVAGELGVRHVATVVRNEHGTKFLSPIFDGAQDLARHNCLCYVNCDIILLDDFARAAERAVASHKQYLMAGQRWDTEITRPVDFSDANWAAKLRSLALSANHQRPPQWIDYFVFSRGLFYRNTPAFVIGRPGWDNWLVWHARNAGAQVVDASAVVVAIHQNHDYSYHPHGEAGVWEGAEAQQNYALLKAGRHFATLQDATHKLTAQGLRPNYSHWAVRVRRFAQRVRSSAWFGLLNATRPLRHRLGLRQGQPSRAQAGEK